MLEQMAIQVSGTCSIGANSTFTCTGTAPSQTLSTSINAATGNVTLAMAPMAGGVAKLVETGTLGANTSTCQGVIHVTDSDSIRYTGSGQHFVAGDLYTEGVAGTIVGGTGAYTGAKGYLAYNLVEANSDSRGYNLYMVITVLLP